MGPAFSPDTVQCVFDIIIILILWSSKDMSSKHAIPGVWKSVQEHLQRSNRKSNVQRTLCGRLFLPWRWEIIYKMLGVFLHLSITT